MAVDILMLLSFWQGLCNTQDTDMKHTSCSQNVFTFGYGSGHMGSLVPAHVLILVFQLSQSDKIPFFFFLKTVLSAYVGYSWSMLYAAYNYDSGLG